MFRQLILGVGNNWLVSQAMQQYGMRLGASRFVAGSELDDAIKVVKDLNGDGIRATLDHLGESITRAEEAIQARDSYLRMLDVIHQEGVQSHVSLKLTMMGLNLSVDMARENLRQIVAKAHDYGNFVRIDMEDSRFTTDTLNLFQEIWSEYPANVGVVLQAYLYRTMDDLKTLSGVGRNLRIVKGAYMEPVSVAFPSKPDVDDNYVRLVEYSLSHGNYTAVATHDEVIIGHVLRYVKDHHIAADQFEFQMLYGVKYSVLRDLAREGYQTRVYVPWGRDWYAYYLRRIAERPANLLFFARNLVKR
ncbi:proline dehydrogenase family protein [Sulfobacillus thermosulfidooxidans]|uniref:proline dehydrogenase family protein n=1 Tax=Sulfobacillus thermosulfidooxidans TaxID=28034 RepID=UPI00096B7ADD|nr:proline dehydrogenase family protein [Sulfobacillus thermosulfidooxidans]OLZ10923.1 proline dehydrogenase [Sulfobacillus thermosulfidooxidans]OLZ14411.1 proline dehydrogenase [Sulfobacillus thermosulfidooxidans]OLZ19154.1 proline dehydrogenase [Sulfobacillus thermosulfidooxidans]